MSNYISQQQPPVIAGARFWRDWFNLTHDYKRTRYVTLENGASEFLGFYPSCILPCS